MLRMTMWDKIVLALIIIGAINCGLIGFLGIDLVANIFNGQMMTGSRIVYAIIGLVGIWAITILFRRRRTDEKSE